LDTIWHFTAHTRTLHVTQVFKGTFVNATEYTERQRPLSGVHSITMEKLAQTGEGGGCTVYFGDHGNSLDFYVKTCLLRDRNIRRQVTKQNTHKRYNVEKGKED
jgi:hypothetical protein